MGINPLYNEINPKVKSALNARGISYGLSHRSVVRGDGRQPGINFPYKKTAFAIVQAIGNDGKVKLSLGTLKEGGFTSLYNTSKGGRNLPMRATLQDVTISNQGEMGSLQKVGFSFNVFTPHQLSYYEKMLMSPGTNIRIKYGWSVGSYGGSPVKGIDSDTYDGIVYNFNYSVNEDGSFSCKVEVVGKGFYAANVSSEATLPADDNPTKDEQGNAIYASDLKKWIEKQIKGSGDSVPVFGNTKLDGIDFYAIELMYDPKQEAPDKDNKSKVESTKMYYMTLDSLVEYFNERVLTQIPRYKEQKIKYSSDLRKQEAEAKSDETVFSESAYYKDLVSSEPDKILFSDQLNAKYGSALYYVGPVKLKHDEKRVNLGEILVSTEFIISTYDSLAKEKEDEPAEKSITAFFSEIFTQISYVTGGVYQLTIVMDEPSDLVSGVSSSDDVTPSTLVIVDGNYTSPSKIVPYMFQRTVEKGLIRDMSMSSKLPNEAAVQMYSGGRTGMTAGRGGNAQKVIEGSPADTGDPIPDESVKALSQLDEAKKAMGDQGSTFTTRSNLRSAMTQYKANPPAYIKDSGGWIDKTLYPIDISLTIDGIAGLRFGNVITTDWLPDKYKKAGNEIVFVITQVDHTVSNNQWTTVISTQCRMKQ